MGKVIAVASQKGGVGKTTTAINLSACAAEAGHRILLVDIDPQGNAASGLGLVVDEAEPTLYEVLIAGLPTRDAIRRDVLPNLDVLPSGQKLSGAEVELVGVMARESKFRNALNAVRDEYEMILVDCPPSLGLLTVNTLTAADSVLIPLQCEYYALEGLTQLLRTIQLVQENLNPGLRIEGVLLTMFDTRLNLSQQVADEARKFFADRVYQTVIPRNVRLSEAPSFGKPIIHYDAQSTGAESYRALAEEVLQPRATTPEPPPEVQAVAESPPAPVASEPEWQAQAEDAQRQDTLDDSQPQDVRPQDTQPQDAQLADTQPEDAPPPSQAVPSQPVQSQGAQPEETQLEDVPPQEAQTQETQEVTHHD
jgi:chromosome partitioning protein